ncbi:MAG: zinc ribbon domain-containing protein [Asgard group archaeon]|nr:zinc ribbon domain-containing protein [Asgard group archaeon]
MSNQTKYCQFCGTAVEPDATFCGNCGAALESQPVKPVTIQPETITYGTQPTQQPTKTTTGLKDHETIGMIGLILGILGCLGPLAGIGNIVAVIMGHSSNSKGSNTLGTFALITGYLGIFLYLVVPAIVIGIMFGLGIW